jgi:hypothetical protein
MAGMTRFSIAAAFAAVDADLRLWDATEDAAVQATAAPADTTTTTPLVVSPMTIVADTQEATMPPSSDVDPSLQGQVDQATADLAKRLSVDESTISTVSASAVTWPDGSLGCPQPGMNYTQVTVDGVLIELAVDGTTYSYHSGGSRGPFLCQKT